MKSITTLTLLVLAALAAGCATLDVNTEGGGNGNGGYALEDITEKMASDSQGGDS